MDYTAPVIPTPALNHHGSAIAFPDHVNQYINTESNFGTLRGPFSQPPFEPWTQNNALMTRPKKCSTDRRVITDLSWPTGQSVNSGIVKHVYMGQPYKLRLPTTDDLCEKMKTIGPQAYLYSRDISRAYRHLRSDPLDWPLLGLKWENKYYFDISIPFGIRWGAMAMQRTTSAISYIMAQDDHDTYNNIDDIVGIEPTLQQANTGFSQLKHLFNDLGLQESEAKAQPPSQIITWLGVEFDASAMEIRMPAEKINDTMA